MTAFKTFMFIVCVPVLLLILIPYQVTLHEPALFSYGFLRWLAIPIWLEGIIGMLWCAYDFVVKGHGTPSPTDPPRELVISGLYRYVRNPMYISGLLLLLGFSLWSPSLPLLFAPFIFAAFAHLFVLYYEEPTLKKKFGAAYEEYCRKVPRWIPRI